MAKKPAGDGDDKGGTELAVDTRVRFQPGTDEECLGVVVDDFGEMDAQPVDIGDQHFADPARRWAVLLDGGTLVFADTDQLAAD